MTDTTSEAMPQAPQPDPIPTPAISPTAPAPPNQGHMAAAGLGAASTVTGLATVYEYMTHFWPKIAMDEKTAMAFALLSTVILGSGAVSLVGKNVGNSSPFRTFFVRSVGVMLLTAGTLALLLALVKIARIAFASA